MKKIRWMGGVYAAAVLAQLLTSLLFLFLPWDPLAEAIILSCFLLLMQGCVFLAESGFQRVDMTERLLGVVYWIRRIVSTVFAAAVGNLVIVLASGVLAVPVWVRGLFALLLALTCAGGVLLLLRAMKPEQAPDETEENS